MYIKYYVYKLLLFLNHAARTHMKKQGTVVVVITFAFIVINSHHDNASKQSGHKRTQVSYKLAITFCPI